MVLDRLPLEEVPEPIAMAGNSTTTLRRAVLAPMRLFGRFTIQTIVVMFVAVLLLTNNHFGKWGNIEDVLRTASLVGIGAAGMTMLMISGAFDLSVAGQIALVATTGGSAIPALGAAGAVALALALGVGLGLLNGLVVTKLKIPAFVATLGMMYVYLAITFIRTNDQVVVITDPHFLSLGTGSIWRLPVPFVLMVIIYALFHLVLHRTPYGRAIRAVGSNERAGIVAGVPVTRVRVGGFALVGLATGLAAVVLAGLLSSANGTMATGYELNAIAVVVVGGTALYGGSGTLFGSFTGALFFAILSNALDLYGVGAYWQYVVAGIVLISALGIYALRRRLMEPTR